MRLPPGEICAAAVWLKLECLQRSGSFKVRGAFNTLLQSTPPPSAVIAASGGNHGIAVATASRACGCPAEIFVPTIASPAKIRALRDTGARVVQVGADYAESLAAMQARQRQTGAVAIHAYDQPSVLAGQGTLTAELAAQTADWSKLIVAVGGGGLIGGAMAWLGGDREVLGVEPARAPTMTEALAHGAPVDVAVGGIAADSLGARRIGALSFALARQTGLTTVLVGDDAIRRAQQWLFAACKVVAEPGGATALAALMTGAIATRSDDEVAVVVCGGNADLTDLQV